MNTPPCRGVIFDLDGTLIDSAPDMCASVNAWFSLQGWPLLEVDFVAQYIGNGPRRLIADLLQALDLPHHAATVDAGTAAYLAHYQAHPVCHTRPYPHVADDLQALHAAGLRLGICTNKPQAITGQVLRALGLQAWFCAFLGSDAASRCKPDPAHLLETAARMQLSARDCVYVGDSVVDQQTATAAGLPFYAVSWGTGAALQVPASNRLARLADLPGRVQLAA